jgi:hypothetical protein
MKKKYSEELKQSNEARLNFFIYHMNLKRR